MSGHFYFKSCLMKLRFLPPAILILLVTSCSTKPDYKPERILSPQQQENLIRSVIRYISEIPKSANLETRLDKQFDSYYEEQVAKHHLDYFHSILETGDVYLLVSRKAQSIREKRVATGIHLKMPGDSISFYHEVFRSWKMEESELQKKGYLLFDLMVKGEDLSPYLPANSGKEEYIEFPDANTWYDTVGRSWVSKLFDPQKSFNEQ